MFEIVVFEISGSCNARCKYCLTGSKKDVPLTKTCGFIKVESMKRAVAHLEEEGLISPKTDFHLYNWGEPFIHPDIKGILEYLNSTQYRYVLSSNAGYFPDLDSSYFTNLREIMVSMPGFSQQSYSRIHGFKFEKVLDNIDRMIEAIGQRKMQVLFHKYKVNGHELVEAREYFRKKHTVFRVYPAYLNYYTMAISYLDGSMDEDFRKEVEDELILDYVPDLLTQRPEGYRCPQFNMLAIDEDCNYLTCCVAPKSHPDYAIGSMFEVSREELLEKKESMSICKKCGHHRLDYWVHNSPIYSTDLFYKTPMARLNAFWWRLKRPSYWFK